MVSRQRFIWDERVMEWVPFALFQRPTTSNIHLIKDDLGVKGVYNPGTGKTYDSKSRYYKDLSARGKHIIERGESIDGSAQRAAADRALDQGSIGRDIKTAIDQLKAGYRG
jgi:hypothetical protein